MSVGLLGGVLKGLVLEVPSQKIVRPTSVRLRRILFDVHQFWNDVDFFDLFAGSGAVGLEAASRGAVSVRFFEKNFQIGNILKQNIEKSLTRFSKQSIDAPVLTLISQDSIKVIHSESSETFKTKPNQRRIFFADPPFCQVNLYPFLIKSFISSGITSGKGFQALVDDELWLEAPKKVLDGLDLGPVDDKVFFCKKYLVGDKGLLRIRKN